MASFSYFLCFVKRHFFANLKMVSSTLDTFSMRYRGRLVRAKVRMLLSGWEWPCLVSFGFHAIPGELMEQINFHRLQWSCSRSESDPSALLNAAATAALRNPDPKSISGLTQNVLWLNTENKTEAQSLSECGTWVCRLPGGVARAGGPWEGQRGK